MLEKMYWHLLAFTYVSPLIGSVFSICISCRENVNKDETGRLTPRFFFLSHTNLYILGECSLDFLSDKFPIENWAVANLKLKFTSCH